ncbi:MAG: ABC transporter permease [Acidimicrobiia bacterium]
MMNARARWKLQATLAVVSAVLAVLTAVNAEWIEELTGLEPDGGNGELEWLFVAAFALVAVLLSAFSYRTRRAALAHS